MGCIFILTALSGCADMNRHVYDGLNARQHALGQGGSMSGTPARQKSDDDEYRKEREAYLREQEDASTDSPAKKAR